MLKVFPVRIHSRPSESFRAHAPLINFHKLTAFKLNIKVVLDNNAVAASSISHWLFKNANREEKRQAYSGF
jgi:hypothetical protein